MNLLLDRAYEYVKAGIDLEIVTGNNDADAALMLLWAEDKFPRVHIEHVKEMLISWGGNSSGVGVANIDSQGDVHPDTFWSGVNMGSIKTKEFDDIWMNTDHPMAKFLRSERKMIHGRCASCKFFEICNGNTRVRAHQLLGDSLASDPGCYLTDDEIFDEIINEQYVNF